MIYVTTKKGAAENVALSVLKELGDQCNIAIRRITSTEFADLLMNSETTRFRVFDSENTIIEYADVDDVHAYKEGEIDADYNVGDIVIYIHNREAENEEDVSYYKIEFLV